MSPASGGAGVPGQREQPSGEISLLGRVADLVRDADTAEEQRHALNAVDGVWPEISAREPNAYDAETCRLAGLLASKVNQPSVARVWRTRSLTRSIASNWTAGVASLLLSEALFELAFSNDFYPEGAFLDSLRPSDAASQIIDEMEAVVCGVNEDLVIGFGAPTIAIVQRFVHENRGLLLLIARRLDEARLSYEHAVEAAVDNPRGRVKSLLGVALVEYVIALRAGETGSAGRTRSLTEEAAAHGFTDLADAGRHNSQEMERGGLHLVPYAIL